MLISSNISNISSLPKITNEITKKQTFADNFGLQKDTFEKRKDINNRENKNFFSSVLNILKNIYHKKSNEISGINANTSEYTVSFGAKNKIKENEITVTENNIGNTFSAAIGKEKYNEIIAEYPEDLTEDAACTAKTANITDEEISEFIKKLTKELPADEAVNEFFKTVKLAELLKHEPLFDTLNYTLEETQLIGNVISDKDGYSQEDLFELFAEKDESIFDLYAEMSPFDKNKEALKDLNNSAIQSLLNTTMKKENIIKLENINGENKYLINPGFEKIPTLKITDYDSFTENLIKSNLLTKDTVDILNNNPQLMKSGNLSKEKTMNIRFPGCKNANVNFVLSDIIKKINDSGINSLTSHETHALTDAFSDEYNKNPNFKKEIIRYVKSPENRNKFEKINGLVRTLEKEAESTTPSDIKIDEHTYMRMIDRNVLTVTDENGNFLKFKDYISHLKQAAADGLITAQRNKFDYHTDNINGNRGITIKVDRDSRKIETVIN